MNVRSWSLAALAAVMLWGSGCVVSSTNSRDRYEVCNASIDTCLGSSCVAANTMPGTASTPGTFCTNSCSDSTQCPADATGLPGVCVISNGTGQCYTSCEATSLGCPSGETCVQSGSMMPYCAPNGGGSGVVTRNLYDACTPGEACTGGGTCTAANTMASTDTTPGTFCTIVGCTDSTQCPADTSGFPGVCVISNGTGQCYTSCEANTLACPTSEQCVQAGAGMMPYCAP